LKKMTETEALEIPEELGPNLEDEREAEAEELELAPEPLFTALLRQAVHEQMATDPVLRDIVEILATPLSMHLAAKQAKGGDFAAKKAKEGIDAARYRHDQSLRAHLVNGLFPVLRIASHLQAWGAPHFRRWDETAQRLFVAGYCLHDWVKLPNVKEQLEAAGLGHDANPNLHLPFIEERFREWLAMLRLTDFLEPIGGAELWLHDLIYIVANTQLKWNTMHNRSALPRMQLAGPRPIFLTDLTCLADRLAYSAPTPIKLAEPASRVYGPLNKLTDLKARLTFHHVTENRGVLTNLLHNAALDLLANEARVPILYAPSGVVYLERIGHAPPLPTLDELAEQVVSKTTKVCAEKVQTSLPGFKSSPTGFRFPDFYWLFFDLPGFLAISPKAAIKAIPFAKKDSFSEKRLDDAVRKNFLPAGLDVNDLPRNRRVDQLAELLQLWVRQVGEKRPTFAIVAWLFQRLGIEDFRPTFEQIVTGGATGGVAYNWYVAAAVAASRQPGLDDAEWDAWLHSHAAALAATLQEQPAPAQADQWANLRDYARQTIRLDHDTPPTVADFAAELAQYQSAKKKGRGTTNVCSLCAAAYRIETQEEPAVLFAPAIYSNRLPLHGGKTQRDICAICALEMMLRKLLMTHTEASGGKFESRKERYLFFYPTYFFTPETLKMLHHLYGRLRRVSITSLRKLVVGEAGDRAEVRLDPATLQRLEDLLLEPRPAEKLEYDPLSRLHYPKNEPLMFDFIGIPPGRDPTDTQAWVHPAMLALLLPLQLDIKLVASESPLPLFVEASGFAETAFLDGPASAFRYLTRESRLTLDDITRKDDKTGIHVGALQRLLVAYFVHTDAHARMGRTGFDYRWQHFPALARALASSPLYLFHYLKKWQRRSDVGLDGLPSNKVQQYLAYYHYFDPQEKHDNGGVTMNHARNLTKTYRRFYRAQRPLNSNRILRPLTIAAKALLDADPRIHPDQEALELVIRGELQGFADRVGSNRALGLRPKGSNKESRQEAIQEFAQQFVRLYLDVLGGDPAALRGRQLNLLKNACEVVYHDEETLAGSAEDVEDTEDSEASVEE
jgi:CRISPR-associated protein Csc3